VTCGFGLKPGKSGEIGKIADHDVLRDIFPKRLKNEPEVLPKGFRIITMHDIVCLRPYRHEIHPGAELLRDSHLLFDRVYARSGNPQVNQEDARLHHENDMSDRKCRLSLLCLGVL